MPIYNDDKLRSTLYRKYVHLQKRMDLVVAPILGDKIPTWEIDPLGNQSAAELQAAIRRMECVLAAEAHGLTRLLARLFMFHSDPDEYGGEGLS
jgi:hypothetical protein